MLVLILWYLSGFIGVNAIIYKHDGRLTMFDVAVVCWIALGGPASVFAVGCILFGNDIVLFSRRKK